MQLNLLTFVSLVQTSAAAVQGKAKKLIDLSVGSVLRATLEANASVAMWLQWLIVLVLSTTRAATSSGVDLDTWVADYLLTRLPASFASGLVTFARFTATNSAFVPVGALVRTADLTQTFAIIEDDTNGRWNAGLHGYLIPAGTALATIKAQALTAGVGGNVQAGTVTLLAAAISGIDTVTNSAPFAGGLDAESDAAVRARFALYINTLFKATELAVIYAAESVQQGVAAVVAENTDPAGNYVPGEFVVTVDDGTGVPSTDLKNRITAAVDLVRPIGSIFTVQSPGVFLANVTLTIVVAAGTAKPPVQLLVSSAFAEYLNSLPIGTPLPYTRLAWVAYRASSAITDVTGLTLNSGTADLVPGRFGVVKAGAIVVN